MLRLQLSTISINIPAYMSQPPSPFERSYSFTDFSINTPNLQQPGNKIDQELNNVRTSLNATISRLGEVQNDDGSIKIGAVNLASIITQVSGPVALDRMLAESAKNDAVLKAAEVDAAKTYVTNVADGLVPAVQLILQNAQDVLAPAAESAFNAEQFSISANQSALAASESYSLSNIARNDAAIAASQAISAAASAAISAASAPAVPTGGSAGQVLSKVDSTDYNTQWIDAPNGGTADALPLAGGTMNVGAVVDFASTSGKDSEIGAWGFGVEDSSGAYTTVEPTQIVQSAQVNETGDNATRTLTINTGGLNSISSSGDLDKNWSLSSDVVQGKTNSDTGWILSKSGVSGANNAGGWGLNNDIVYGEGWSFGSSGITFQDSTVQTTAGLPLSGGTLNDYAEIKLRKPYFEDEEGNDHQDGVVLIQPNSLTVGWDIGYPNDEYQPLYRTIISGDTISQYEDAEGKNSRYSSYGWSVANGALIGDASGITFPDNSKQSTAGLPLTGGTLNDYAEIKLRKPATNSENNGVVLIQPNSLMVGYDTGYPYEEEFTPFYRTIISGDTISQYEDANANTSLYSSTGWSVASGALIGDASGITFPDSTIQTTAAVLPSLTPYLQKSDNLASLTSSSNARTNLGLGSMAVENTSNYLTASSIASTYLSQSSAASTYYTKPTGTTGQYIRGDGSFATYSSGDKYLTSSTTSLTISNGSKTLTIGTGLSYSTQQDVTIAYDSSNHMHATVTSYNSSTGVIVCDVYNKAGSGTYAAWTVNVGGVQGGSYLQISNNLSDLTSASTARTNLGLGSSSTNASTVFLQTANNLSDVTASTARTNLGLAYATDAQALAGTSASNVMTPSNSMTLAMHPEIIYLNPTSFSSAVSGTGFAGTTDISSQIFTGTSANSYGIRRLVPTTQATFSRGQAAGVIDFSKQLILSGSSIITQNVANTNIRCSIGKISTDNNGDLARAGIGWKKAGTNPMQLMVHNGSSLTVSTNGTYTPTVNSTFDWQVVADGTGNATLYVNESSVATTTGCPTGLSGNTADGIQFEADCSANLTTSMTFIVSNPKLLIGR